MIYLNKEICKKCINKHRVREISLLKDGPDLWGSFDEDNWKEDAVVCETNLFLERSPVVTLTNQKPPEWCKYFLEHIVLSKKNLRNSHE